MFQGDAGYGAVHIKVITDSYRRWNFSRESMPYLSCLAERQGFEPWVRFHAHTLSKRAP